MKTLIVGLLFLGLSNVSYSQSKEDKVKLKMEELPEVVIKNAGKDFSVYLPDKNPDKDVRQVQNNFVGYKLGKDFEGYDTYLVTMKIKKGSLVATYDEKGKLTRVVENYENVKLPSEVIFSVYTAFPGWQMVNDKFLYTQSQGDIIKKQYNIKIKKDKEIKKLIVHPNGEILAGLD